MQQDHPAMQNDIVGKMSKALSHITSEQLKSSFELLKFESAKIKNLNLLYKAVYKGNPCRSQNVDLVSPHEPKQKTTVHPIQSKAKNILLEVPRSSKNNVSACFLEHPDLSAIEDLSDSEYIGKESRVELDFLLQCDRERQRFNSKKNLNSEFNFSESFFSSKLADTVTPSKFSRISRKSKLSQKNNAPRKCDSIKLISREIKGRVSEEKYSISGKAKKGALKTIRIRCEQITIPSQTIYSYKSATLSQKGESTWQTNLLNSERLNAKPAEHSYSGSHKKKEGYIFRRPRSRCL